MILRASSERSDVGIKGHFLMLFEFKASCETSHIGIKGYFLVLFEVWVLK